MLRKTSGLRMTFVLWRSVALLPAVLQMCFGVQQLLLHCYASWPLFFWQWVAHLTTAEWLARHGGKIQVFKHNTTLGSTHGASRSLRTPKLYRVLLLVTVLSGHAGQLEAIVGALHGRDVFARMALMQKPTNACSSFCQGSGCYCPALVTLLHKTKQHNTTCVCHSTKVIRTSRGLMCENCPGLLPPKKLPRVIIARSMRVPEEGEAWFRG